MRMMPPVRRAALLASFMPFLSSCVAEDKATAEGEWRIVGEPTVVIGAGADPEIALDNVTAAAHLSDGAILVVDGSSRLTEFARDGGYDGTIGRQGDGPGEFQWITSLQVGPSDSLFIFDNVWQRLTVFSSDRRPVRMPTFRVEAGVTGADGLFGVTRLADGVWVGTGAESTIFGPPDEIVRDTIVVGLLDGSLSRLRPLIRLPGRMSTSTMIDGRPIFGTPPFTPEVIFATWGRCIFFSTAEEPLIWAYGSDGELVTTFVGPGARRSITQEHLETRLKYDLRNASVADTARSRRLLFDIARPTHLPYFHRMEIDQWGHVWLQEYAPPWGVGRRWFVLSQAGEHLSTVIMPKAMKVFSISEAGVLGRSLGPLDEEMVELFPLRERPAQPATPLRECVV